jgi:hypothetical protein
VVLRQEDLVVAETLGALDLVEDRLVELGERPAPRGRIAEIFHEAEFHLTRPSRHRATIAPA